MSALVPLNNASALPRLSAAGVGEVYVGFHDDRWSERFGSSELNRMSGFGREANPFDFDEMCDRIADADDLDIEAHVCFNAASYTPEQVRFIADRYLGRLRGAGAASLIVSSLALIGPARHAGLGVTVSTIAGIYNASLAAYYRDHGATRLILPRDLAVAEIEEIVRMVPEPQYEVFLMRNGCMFSDSHCLGCHRAGRPSLCTSLRSGFIEIGPTAMTEQGERPHGFIEQAQENEALLNGYYHKRTCGLCALWRFERLGIAAYKVVGRGDDIDDLCSDAALVVRNARIARECETEHAYFQRMEQPRDPETLCGYAGLSCYYPEVARCVSR